jgi:hypothetical protein
MHCEDCLRQQEHNSPYIY